MIRPVGFRVLVKPDEVETKSAGGIVLVTDEELQKIAQIRGTVVAVGELAFKAFDRDENGRPCGKPWAKVGDTVYFARYAGRFIQSKKSGEEFLIMNDEDITAVEEE